MEALNQKFKSLIIYHITGMNIQEVSKARLNSKLMNGICIEWISYNNENNYKP